MYSSGRDHLEEKAMAFSVTLSMFVLGLEGSFAILRRLMQGRLCHSHRAEAHVLGRAMLMSSDTQLPGTSLSYFLDVLRWIFTLSLEAVPHSVGHWTVRMTKRKVTATMVSNTKGMLY